MAYAHVTNGTIDQVGNLPALWWDGTRWWDLRTEDPAAIAAAGWRPVTETPRPADTATTTYVEGFALVGSVPTQTWTARPWTTDELAARTAAANAATLTATADLQARLTRLAAYKVDTDLTAVLGQTNNQALPTASLNRALKTMIRREERLSATLALLVRLIDPALLADTSDTTDA